jgi:FKBP-type peptidyl-prolyl cis-trans isomerase
MSLLTSRRSVLLLALSASLGLAACGGGSSGTPATSDPNGWNAVTALKTTDTTVGTGAVAETGKTATVTYTGYLYDVRVADTRGTKFDSGSFSFKLGTNAVIAGFETGVTGMKVGGKRTVTIPAALGYGATGAGNGVIPPNAALVFDIELTAVN